MRASQRPVTRSALATGNNLDSVPYSGYSLPRMKYEVIVAKDAQIQFGKLDGRWRSRLKNEMRQHLEHQPKRESKSRIKRLRGLRQPQYRMRVDHMRVFYDVNDEMRRVEVLGFMDKSDTPAWLNIHGVPE